MQTFFTTTCLLFFTFNISLAQTNHNDLKDVNLKGNVKSFGQCFLEGTAMPLVDNNKICQSGIGNMYNEKGFLLSSNSVSYNAKVFEIKYYYDTDGVLNASDYYYPGTKMSQSFLITVKHDTTKNEVSYWFYEGSVLQSKTVFIRDEKGNLVVHMNYGKDEKLNMEKHYEYDAGNYRIKESFWSISPAGYLDKPILKSVVTYKNDEFGNPVMKTNSSSKETTTYTYKYDNNGNWLLRTSYNDKGEINQIAEQYFEYY